MGESGVKHPGLYGMNLRRRPHKARVWQRYIFLRQQFGLDKQEAWKLAEELEKWWDGKTA